MGQRIRRLRLDRGMSQRELAEPGVSYAYLSRIEAGQRAPSLKALRIVARKLGVTVEHLETGSPVSIANVRELRPGDYLVETAATPKLVAELTAWLAEQGALVSELRAGRRSLEDVFLRLTGEGRS